MGCAACADAQEAARNGGRIAYYRWKNATIAVLACNMHLVEIFDALNAVQKEKK